MCGRCALSLNKEQVRCACSYKPRGKEFYTKPEWVPEYNDGKEYIPSHNIAPTDITPVLVPASDRDTDGGRILKPMMWGIIPPWHKGDYKSHNLTTNNCRLENIKSSKLYSPILRNGGRCVIVVEGFYEWKTTSKISKVKQPYYIYAPQDDEIAMDEPITGINKYTEKEGWKGVKLLHMAGLYSVWQNDNTVIYSYSIITMESNSTMDWLHHRMPAILYTEELINIWLDVSNVNSDLAISYIRPVNVLSWHPVSMAVNNSKNKFADCNKRQPEKKSQGSQRVITAWFSKTEKRKSSELFVSPCKKSKT